MLWIVLIGVLFLSFIIGTLVLTSCFSDLYTAISFSIDRNIISKYAKRVKIVLVVTLVSAYIIIIILLHTINELA